MSENKNPAACCGSALDCGERGITFGDHLREHLAAQITPIFVSLIWTFYFTYVLAQASLARPSVK
jgi:hypothetical protein